MFMESKRMIEGTKHHNDWFFYHDALSLMTSGTSRTWMRNTVFDGKIIMERWLVPQNQLNAGTIFCGRPVGNSPGFMPLNNSLNQDMLICHRYYCAVTDHLPDDDARRFSLRTLCLIARRIKRIMEYKTGVPTDKHILQDCHLIITNMVIVYQNDGKVVPGLANRND